MPHARVAVIDIGSNSGRVVVFAVDRVGHLRIVSTTRAALRLVGDVDREHALSPAAVERALDALADFRAMAIGAGARRIVAVATAAVRDARNGRLLIRRVRREVGLTVRVIDGREEARFGFLGALHGLDVGSGLLFDLGGGSLQITRFTDRKPGRSWSLPLGALRTSATFLSGDPPRASELKRLASHVRRLLSEADIPSLNAHGRLVGTGGTLRNLAKIDLRSRPYPVTHLHGYLLDVERVGEIAGLLAATRLKKRDQIPGLSDERADSIVGGAWVIAGLARAVGAGEILVSGQGVREGLAYSLLGDAVPAPRSVREAAIASLAARFADFDPALADRRRRVGRALLDALVPKARPDIREALDDAARLLDIGRAVDFFDRHEHVADIVMATELDGFSHREMALLAAVLRRAGEPRWDPRELDPLVAESDRATIERASVLLLLADDIVERCQRNRPIGLRCRIQKSQVVVSVPTLAGWRPRGLATRFDQAFGRRLIVRAGAARNYR